MGTRNGNPEALAAVSVGLLLAAYDRASTVVMGLEIAGMQSTLKFSDAMAERDRYRNEIRRRMAPRTRGRK